MTRFLYYSGLLLWAAGCATGCSTPCATCGWRFEVGRPSVFSSPGLVQQTSGPLTVSPLGSTIPPVLTGTAATPGAVRLMPMQQPQEFPPTPRALAPAPDCTCEELLAALRRIEARLVTLGAARMPQGPKNEE